ncbi:serine protein kinase, putative [Ichthyophthirius multifiliis]|uniref:non-specific serine/threonine protein kinase n=1 Tax=Ichthyophthirius multifiliis TaxID=5932 RepID=G0QZQ5_ICHMU|nr:serine protein kinase, putative [Ichthyophthirius multifiliis]EGR29294.1 serine protein kinase, putative [Ichthyophthirius multifiliis]|eukprot:XP_004030530.1 serine protein kinase, putative [Ichthyophthirius multifiliis]
MLSFNEDIIEKENKILKESNLKTNYFAEDKQTKSQNVYQNQDNTNQCFEQKNQQEATQTDSQNNNEEQTLEQLLDQVGQEHDSEDEGIQDYKIGGYHPVHIGEVINKRYVVIQKIGWGHFSTVWLAKDFKYETYVALKVQKCANNYLEAAFDEVEVLQKVAQKCKDPEWLKDLQKYHQDENRKYLTKDDCQVVQLLNSFIYNGPYGSHFCFVFEILGVNLLEVIKRYNYQGVPMNLCRKIAKQCLIGLDFLDRYCNVIHTDLKPENVLLQLTQEDLKDIVENGQIKGREVCEQRLQVIRKLLGLQEIMDIKEEKINENEKKEAVLIGNMYNQTADIWSLACMLFEILTGDFLFEPRKGPNFSKNDDHLAQIQELCKKFPKNYALKGTNSKISYQRKEAREFEDFMMQMLNCIPEKRKTAQQMLEHPWLKGQTNEYEYKMNEQQYNDYMKAKQKQIDIAKLIGYEIEQDKNYISSSDDHDADNEQNDNLGEDEDDSQFYDYKPNIDRKLVDRSFTNLGYIGYGDGINFGELDNAGNWQFINTK